MDHDQRIKVLIETFFEEFIRLFFAEWAECLDFGSLDWQPTEVFDDPPTGTRGAVDLVAKSGSSSQWKGWSRRTRANGS